MSGRNFFDQEEEEFRDQPDEVSGKDANEILQQHPGAPTVRRTPLPPPQEIKAQAEEVYENEDFDLSEELGLEDEDEEDYSAVLSDARLRLEQGRLYEQIMNHDLFEGLDADPAAVKHVQRQIRKFAKEQMEIMLGMRRETAVVERLEIDFPFNAVEVKVLRMIAEKASGGASKESDRFVPDVKRTTEEIPTITAPKRTGLNPIVGKKQAPKPQPRVEAPTPKSALKKTAAAPVARKPKSDTPEQVIVDGEVVTKDQIDATFEPDYKPLAKPLHEMSSEELLRRNQETSKRRHKTVKNPNAQPMPSYEQEEFMHLQRHAETAGKSNAVALIMAAMNQKK